jgi:hypothetical protein
MSLLCQAGHDRGASPPCSSAKPREDPGVWRRLRVPSDERKPAKRRIRLLLAASRAAVRLAGRVHLHMQKPSGLLQRRDSSAVMRIPAVRSARAAGPTYPANKALLLRFGRVGEERHRRRGRVGEEAGVWPDPGDCSFSIRAAPSSNGGGGDVTHTTIAAATSAARRGSASGRYPRPLGGAIAGCQIPNDLSHARSCAPRLRRSGLPPRSLGRTA